MQTQSNDTVEIVSVTPAMADLWLSTSKYHGQRRINENRVDKYKADMLAGRWTISESMIVLGLRDEGEHLLNGQHRLNAVSRAGIPCSFIVCRSRFNSDDDMDMAYASMDDGLARTFVDRTAALGLPDKLRVPYQTVNRSFSAILSIYSGFTSRGGAVSRQKLFRSISEKEAVLLEWVDNIYAYHHACLGAHTSVARWFDRVPVMAVGLVTFRFSPQKASEFWHVVAQNDGLSKGSPEHTLFMFLNATRAIDIDIPEYTRKVAACWNAFYEGRDLSAARARPDLPILIQGTPWNGRDNVDVAKVIAAHKLHTI